jgi:protein-S-isoprenylcysteine O-methyltransferase Ste14
MNKLIIPTIRNFLLGVSVLGLMLFLPAWTLNYWQAWVFILLFMVLLSAGGVYFSIKDPALIERRLQTVPTEGTSTGQKIFVVVAFLGDIALLVFSALDHRFGWSRVPPYVSWVGDLLVVLSCLIWYFVFRENSFAASAVQTFEEQKVISTGPYAFVRHPLYVGVLVLIIGIPLALGSWWGLLFFVLVSLGLVWRILGEEKLLKKDLPGYIEYTKRVRYRLVPYVW